MADLEAVRRDLLALLGVPAVRCDEETLAAHRCDYWSLSQLRLMRGNLRERPLCVVAPADTEAVRKTLRYANEHHLPVVAYGGGSGVCGGILPASGAIVIDLHQRMNRLVDVNPVALFARVQAGMMGSEFEAALNERGFSCGHFPQSIDVSTVGGWVATRAAGQFSTRYGSIEDRLIAFEAVLADGTVVCTRPVPRSSTGPDLRHFFLGSEGTLGIVTEVTLKVHPLPAARELASFRFADMASGLEAMRTTIRDGWLPPVLRLYDREETARHFPEVEPCCLLLVLSEGPAALAAAEAESCAASSARAGGVPAGPAPVEKWLRERNVVPGFEPFLEKGYVLDTIEVAAPWDRILGVYEGAVGALKRVAGVVVATAHSSHSYLTGTCLYFSFVAQPEKPEAAEDLYRRCWEATMSATVSGGGTIAHHHGIGRVRRGWMAAELGEGVKVLRAVKRALDPNGILNPGVLLPPASG